MMRRITIDVPFYLWAADYHEFEDAQYLLTDIGDYKNLRFFELDVDKIESLDESEDIYDAVVDDIPKKLRQDRAIIDVVSSVRNDGFTGRYLAIFY